MKKLLFILMLCFTALSTAGAQQTEKPLGKVYDIVEVMPQFPGGQGELMKFLRNNVKYPAEAQKKKIDIIDPTVERSAHPLLDAEALRVVKRMPKWTPGRMNGESVNVKFRLPITFKL